MGNVKSDLIFLNYQITELDFKVNQQFVDQNVPIDIKYQISVGISVNEQDPIIHKVMISCCVFDEAEKNNYPFVLKVSIEGLFDCKNIKPEDINGMLQLNAVAILLPYLRATVSTVTALTGLPTLNLPLINVHNLASTFTVNSEIQEKQ